MADELVAVAFRPGAVALVQLCLGRGGYAEPFAALGDGSSKGSKGAVTAHGEPFLAATVGGYREVAAERVVTEGGGDADQPEGVVAPAEITAILAGVEYQGAPISHGDANFWISGLFISPFLGLVQGFCRGAVGAVAERAPSLSPLSVFVYVRYCAPPKLFNRIAVNV